MTSETLLRQITDYTNRADPYPLYAELRKTPVARQEDGTYVVSTYDEILSLLHDPRISSDLRNRTQRDGVPPTLTEITGLPPTLIKIDPPEHDRLRRLAMRQFGPPHCPMRIDGMRKDIACITAELIDGFDGRSRIDLVEDFSYPLPVAVICTLMGVPREDEPRFHRWADALVASVDPRRRGDVEQKQQTTQKAMVEMGEYMTGLAEQRCSSPREDMLSGLATDDGTDGRLSPVELVTTAMLLFVAGHETTVNLITNGMLAFLRHPDLLDRVRRDPDLMFGAVEELLRYEPPIQMLPQRTPLVDVDVCGTIIPKGSPLTLMLAAGNRDPGRFVEPDRFDPERTDVEHLGFGSGVHSCFGAPLARLETQIALTELIRRLDSPRLVDDPPVYRTNPVLRGPQHLPIDFTGLSC